MEWVDPRYAELTKHLKQQRPELRQRSDDRPVRGFILAPQPGKH